jgi:hypothetical protein
MKYQLVTNICNINAIIRITYVANGVGRPRVALEVRGRAAVVEATAAYRSHIRRADIDRNQ